MQRVTTEVTSFSKRFPRYTIDQSGTIFDKQEQVNVSPTRNDDGILMVRLVDENWQWQNVSVAELIVLAFGPIVPDWKRPFIQISYLDNDPGNPSIGNLVWTITDYVPAVIPGVNCPEDTLVTIPEFSAYRIDIHGRVYSWNPNCAQYEPLGGGYVSDSGYPRIRLNDDIGVSRTIPIHRLMGLTFLKHPMDTGNLVVNHKNGDKLDYRLDNLEWVSHLGNMHHAVETGLIVRRSAVVAIDLKTQTEKVYPHADAAAEDLNIPKTTLRRWLASPDPLRQHNGICVKYIDDPRVWPKLDTPYEKSRREGKPILVKDIETGEVTRFENAYAVADKLGVNHLAVYRWVNQATIIPHQGYLMQYENPMIMAEWPTYTKNQLENYSLGNNNRINKLLLAKNLVTGETKKYPSLVAFCRESGLSTNHARAAIRSPTGCKGYKLTELTSDADVRREAVGPLAIQLAA
jgi:hypothetical protein